MNRNSLMKGIYFISAFLSVLALGLISFYIIKEGIPAIRTVGLKNFLLGRRWSPNENIYGIFPMIITSIYTSFISIILGGGLGIFTAIYLVFYGKGKFNNFLKSLIELLAGVPSIIFGFIGLVVIVPIVRLFIGGTGKSVLSGSILLSLMIIPTVVSISETSLRQVNRNILEGSLALGASKEVSIFKAILPAAKSGLMSAIILGLGRSIGETTAVIMILGNQPVMPKLLSGARSLTGNIIMELGYATDIHRQALMSTAVVLFIFSLLINILLLKVRGNDNE